MRPFSIFILFSAILLVSSSADEYDITKNLNDIISETLKYFEKRNTSDVLKKLFAYDYTDVFEIEPYIIRKVIIYEVDSNGTSIYYGFRDNKIQIHSSSFMVKFLARIRENGTLLDENEKLLSFKIIIDSCLLTAMYNSNKLSGPPHLRKIYYEYGDVKFDYHQVVDSTPSPSNLDLESISLSFIEELIERNENQNHVLSKGFDDMLPQKRIISNHPKFSDDEEKYYYEIPNISFGRFFDLTNIVARGLSNINSANYIDEPEKSSLVIGNICGSMIAHISSLSEVRKLELTFEIDLLYISVNWDDEEIDVEATKFSINETKSGRKFSDFQSRRIMDRIESAIASAIMPSMTQIRRSDEFMSTTEELYSFLKELSLKEENKSTPESIRNQHATTKTQNDRPIIQNNYLTINFVPCGNYQYPQNIQCPVLNSSMFTHRISLDSLGKLSSNNSGPHNMDLHFHFNFPSLNISVGEPQTINNSNSNDSCGLQIRNDEDIKVELFSTSTNSTIQESSQQLKIKKQINSTLMSMMKERIVRTMKPIVSAPFDLCTQSVKMVDDFFQRFVSDVLKKCSFRRNKKT